VAEGKPAMKERTRELKAQARRGLCAGKADEERAVLAKIVTSRKVAEAATLDVREDLSDRMPQDGREQVELFGGELVLGAGRVADGNLEPGEATGPVKP
jgi:hypothetical protein